MQTFQDRLRSLIDTLGITKTKFAEDLHVSSAFVSMLCSGKSLPSDRTIADICRKYNVSETWLRTGEGEMGSPSRMYAGKRLKRSRSTVSPVAIVPLFPSVCNKPVVSNGNPAGRDAPLFLPAENAAAAPAGPAGSCPASRPSQFPPRITVISPRP